MKTRRRPPARVAAAGRYGFRRYGSATASRRQPPEYILIGAKRGGTTSVHFALLEHPQVLPLFPEARWLPKARDGKGPHYFDSNYHRPFDWYLSHFASDFRRGSLRRTTGHEPVTGESSPYYLFHPHAAQRIHRDVPQVKLLVALRNPIERAYSHYREQVRNGVETLSFEQALERESAVLARETQRMMADPGYVSSVHEHQSYATQSEYAASLRRWMALFDRDQMHVWFSEQYYTEPATVLAGVSGFLCLAPYDFPSATHLNAAPRAPLAEATRQTLIARFAEDVEQVSDLLGQRPPWPEFGGEQ